MQQNFGFGFYFTVNNIYLLLEFYGIRQPLLVGEEFYVFSENMALFQLAIKPIGYV